MTGTAPSPEELTERTRESALWMGATSILWQLLSWALTFVCLRYLLPSDYGVVALAETFTPYLFLLASLSVASWLVQESVVGEDDIHAAAMFSCLLSGFVTAITFLCSPFIANFYRDPQLLLPFQIISFIFIIRGFGAVPDAVLRRNLRFREVSIISLIVVLLRGLVQLVLAMLGYGFWSLIAGMMLAEIATTVFTALLAKEALPWKFRPAVWKRICIFGVPSALSAVCWIVFTSADNIIVGRFFGKEALGIYAMAYYFSSLPMNKINSMFRNVTFSYLSRLKDDRPRFVQACLDFNRTFCLVIFPVLLGILLVAPNGVPLVFGPKWAALPYPLQILCIGALSRVVVDNLPMLLSSNGTPVTALKFQFIGALLLPLGFFIGAWNFGLYGIYATWIFLYPVVMLIAIYISAPVLGISVRSYIRNLLSPIASGAIMVACVLGVQMGLTSSLHPLSALVIDIIVGILSYTAALFGVFPKDAKAFVDFLFRKQDKTIKEEKDKR